MAATASTPCYVGDNERNKRPHLKDLYDHVVVKAARKWKEIGAQLLVNDCEAVLNNIEDNCHQQVEKCCERMLQKWLGTNVSASWDELIQALTSPSVQLNHLASDITKMLEMKRKSTNSAETTRQGGVKLTDIDRIEEEFAKTTNRIKQTLQDKNVNVVALVEQLCAISAVRSKKVPIFDEEVSEKVKSIDELWKKLKCHWTIYDYDVLVFVVNLTECTEAQQILDDFLAKIDPSALEDVDLVLRCKIYNEEELLKPLLRIKVNAEKCTGDIKRKVEEIISKEFKLEKYSLRFKGIKEGCIELLYHVSKPLISYLLQFKVTGSIMAELAANNIISLYINDVTLPVRIPSENTDIVSSAALLP